MSQTEQPRPTQPSSCSLYALIALLAVILILLGAAWWVYRTYQAPSVPTPLVYQPSSTLSPSPTATEPPVTPSRTPRPTWTLRPILTDTPTLTLTPSQTATSTRLPTLTPARPYRYNDPYQLIPWTAELAQQAAQMALEYPDVLYPKPESKTQPAYHAAFSAAVYAYREALLRFPDDPRARAWQWRLAYSLAQVGDPQAVPMYASLIQAALKRGDLRAEDLPEWFQRQEPKLTLQIENLPAEPGQLNQDLIRIVEGGVLLWLVETPRDVQVKPLTSLFNFTSAAGAVHLFGDLTGDGKTEIVIYQPEAESPSLLNVPRTFSLAGPDPQELPVQNSPPYDLQTDFTTSLEAAPQGGFILKAALFPACPVIITRAYSWNGSLFFPAALQVQVKPQPTLAQYCEPALRHALASWGAPETLALLESLLPIFPPERDLENLPYPADTKDELRFYQGVYQALNGQFDQASQSLRALKDSPTVPESRWVIPASQFLANYHTQADLYRACLSVATCNPRLALERLALTSRQTDPSQALEDLRQKGVTLRSSGTFDFDLDGKAERWFTIQPRPGQNLEFWILAASPMGTRARYVDFTLRDQPTPFYNSPAAQTPPVFQIEAQKGFQLKRVPESGEPYIVPAEVAAPITTYTRDALQEAQQALLSGADPASVRDELLDVLNSGRFNCLNHRICDRFYYTLGLAYELAGDVREAIETYIKLWWENSRSPYTKIARMKVLLNTPTPSPTRPAAVLTTPGVLPTTTLQVAPTENPYP